MKKKNNIQATTTDDQIYLEIKQLITSAQQDIYHYVNFKLVQTYWEIGKILYEKCGESEKGIRIDPKISKIGQKLTKEFGNSFNLRNLQYMRKFYITYPLANALRSQVSWTHYRLLIRIKDNNARDFYENETIANQWSSRQLERQIKTHYYERLVSNQTQKQIALKDDRPITNYIVDPAIFEFLQLPTNYSEKELEDALLANITDFLRELGRGYSFVDRQKHIVIDDKHFYIDLVFRNDIMNCYVLIELKVGELKPNDLGQLQMYLNYYEKNLMKEGDNPPIGILLCADKNETVVEYSLPKDNDSIYVSKYLDYLPSKEEIKKILKLRD